MKHKEAVIELVTKYVEEWNDGERYTIADKLSFRTKTSVLYGAIDALYKVSDDDTAKYTRSIMNTICDIIDIYESFDYFNVKNKDWYNPDLNVRDEEISCRIRSLTRIVREMKLDNKQ